MKILVVFGLLAGALLLPAAAHAQPASGSRVVTIRLTAEECDRVPNEISVVLNGREGEEAFPARRETGTDRWIGESDAPFDPATSYASLRLGVSRTDCIPTVPDDGEARLIFFACPRQPIRTVAIETDPKTLAVRYVREVPANRDNRRSIPCREQALLPRGEDIAQLVQFQAERLRLQLGGKEPDPKAPHAERPGLIVDHASVIKDARNGVPNTLGPEVVLEAFRTQRSQGLLGTRPSVSPNASENDRLRLVAAGLTSLVVTVK
jgi:hypothetical protein